MIRDLYLPPQKVNYTVSGIDLTNENAYIDSFNANTCIYSITHFKGSDTLFTFDAVHSHADLTYTRLYKYLL